MRTNTLTLLLALLALSGCTMRLGVPPRVDQLGSLTLNITSSPMCYWRWVNQTGPAPCFSDPQSARRDVWFYEYAKATSTLTSSKQEVLILLVFFDGDRYGGHYWFGEHANIEQGEEIMTGRLQRRWWALVVAATAVMTISACNSVIQIRSGRQVDPALLDTALTVGQSTAEDVRSVLGEPEGKGREALPTGQPPRTIWTYSYDASMAALSGSGSDSRRMYVLVFLKDDTYDGYLWFSSLLEHQGATLIQSDSTTLGAWIRVAPGRTPVKCHGNCAWP